MVFIVIHLSLPQRYDMKDVLSGAYLLSEIDKETVVELLELLVPEKLRYELAWSRKLLTLIHLFNAMPDYKGYAIISAFETYLVSF